MNNARLDYFKPTTPIETILRRIKGNMRSAMVVDSVHGEVISLRARRDQDGRTILLRMVDEYGDIAEEEYKLEKSCFSSSLTAEEVLQVFNNSEPCACLQSCGQRFSSDFYPGWDELADKLNIKQVWKDQ